MQSRIAGSRILEELTRPKDLLCYCSLSCSEVAVRLGSDSMRSCNPKLPYERFPTVEQSQWIMPTTHVASKCM